MNAKSYKEIMIYNTPLIYSLRSALLRLCVCSLGFGLVSCGGSGGGGDSSTEITLGGASCESGVAFNDNIAQGYDSLYTLQNQADPNQADPRVRVVFDAASQPAECTAIATSQDVVPWIRVDSSDPLDTSKNLRFELVAPGGRNEPVLAQYPISDGTKESIRGTFSYTIDLPPSAQNNGTSCEVTYSGSYCPMVVSGRFLALNFSAAGSLDCSILHSNGSTPTECHGTISATSAALNLVYYGE